LSPDTTPDSGASAEGWTTTEVAARALSITPRTVRRYIEQGRLTGRQVKRGRAKPWEVEIASLKALRNELVADGSLAAPASPDEDIEAGGYEEGGRPVAESAYVELARELAQASARAARAETRAELTVRAESSLKEELERERARSDKLERELREARKGFWRRLFGRSERPET
jgi:hypothetical protein